MKVNRYGDYQVYIYFIHCYVWLKKSISQVTPLAKARRIQISEISHFEIKKISLLLQRLKN